MDQNLKGRHGYVQKVNEKAREYLYEILKENERLRVIVARKEHELLSQAEAFEKSTSLEHENKHLKEMSTLLEDQVRSLKKQNLEAQNDVGQAQAKLARLERQIAQVETENREFLDQYSFVEKQNSDLMNLYVTSYRIHGTIDRTEVLDAIKETLINIIGSEEFGVWEMGSDGKTLTLACSMGLDAGEFGRIPFGEGPIGEAVAKGETLVTGPENAQGALPSGKKLVALVPLRLGQEISGCIAIFSLLPQKNETLDEVDLELFDLLATHAATALYCSRLHLQVSAGK